MQPHRAGGPSYSIEAAVGPLVEARIFHLRDLAMASEYAAALGSKVAQIASNPVLLADHRPVVVYTQVVADRLAELFAAMNARLERVAILVRPSNATLLFQLDRIVREASFTSRRVFQAPESALEHLRTSLDDTSMARARAFLAEWHG